MIVREIAPVPATQVGRKPIVKLANANWVYDARGVYSYCQAHGLSMRKLTAFVIKCSPGLRVKRHAITRCLLGFGHESSALFLADKQSRIPRIDLQFARKYSKISVAFYRLAVRFFAVEGAKPTSRST